MNSERRGLGVNEFFSFIDDEAFFTFDENYPVIEDWMVSPTPPKKIIPFDKALKFRGDLSEYFICTYSNDKTFERVRQNPKRYLSFFKRCAGIIGFDFSVGGLMPIAKQKGQMCDNLALTYYYAKHNIPVIPNLRCDKGELLDEYLEAFPEHTLLAVGVHGSIKEYALKVNWWCFLDTIIKKLKPTGIIVYGPLKGKMFEELKKRCPFYIYEPWTNSRKKKKKRTNDKIKS